MSAAGGPPDGSDRLRSLFHHHPHGVFALDRSGQVVEVNPAAKLISGFSEDELLSMGFEDLVHPDDFDRAATALTLVLGGEAQQVELMIVGQGGRTVDLAVTVIPWVEGGEVRGVYGIVEDVTQRNRTARELDVTRLMAVAANEAKADFVARMSHDVRTPLTSILATIDLLAGTDDESERAELVELLRRSGHRLLRLVDGVLDFGATSTADAEDEEFDLHAVVRDAVDVAAEVADGKGVAVRLDLEADVPRRVRDHPRWTSQILTNLLTNAVEHTAVGHVELTVSTVRSPTSGQLVMYRVADTGAGIDPVEQLRVFEPFTTGSDTSAAGGGGRRPGLGLSIVKQLVTISGGSLALDSVPGRGSTFTVVLPVRAVRGGSAPSA